LRLPGSGPLVTVGAATSLAEIDLFIFALPWHGTAFGSGREKAPVPSPA
jgi:hypothetical protein